MQRAGWASDHGFLLKDVFIMGQRWFAADGVFSARSSVLLAANLMQRGRLNAGDADVMRPLALDTVQGLPE